MNPLKLKHHIPPSSSVPTKIQTRDQFIFLACKATILFGRVCIKVFSSSLVLSFMTLSPLYDSVTGFHNHSSPSLFPSLSFSMFPSLFVFFFWVERGSWT